MNKTKLGKKPKFQSDLKKNDEQDKTREKRKTERGSKQSDEFW